MITAKGNWIRCVPINALFGGLQGIGNGTKSPRTCPQPRKSYH